MHVHAGKVILSHLGIPWQVHTSILMALPPSNRILTFWYFATRYFKYFGMETGVLRSDEVQSCGLKQHPQVLLTYPLKNFESVLCHTFLDQHPKDFKPTSTFPKDVISGSWKKYWYFKENYAIIFKCAPCAGNGIYFVVTLNACSECQMHHSLISIVSEVCKYIPL